ncbi:MAG: hypothetical protein COZ70_03650 [Deltaproteobacteria bacterium CG_4_8_14_3_um_filter_51_11]|nr:oligosaccharide flippase family protein [bacterium]PIP48263.1 MAG: hypothetical protein COX16_01615 [Deltaproteobacteria bacterium CG23_combo_of_CG06-09_8_20_14_all_51_20]PIX20426.1 MAG: hypothetical protein COZ70_03650 [Deltaproteobacteria bacterium CG_4_8_14_3_um_filter_51_11]PIY22308.1 MAG: hypothetical protein COZ11_13220 [Deltaproteobacteria bacterium CG_4_10_14_3_um_filter_51_14]PJB33372.1 MAG: hypothetical protein CO107_15790 [Deltaproteobacteria bacterium CG_4_9_14_3_um_filter_51_14]
MKIQDTDLAAWRQLPLQWVATIYVAAVSTGIFFFLGRFLGPEQFGLFNYALSVIALITLFLDGGFHILIFRERIGSKEAGDVIGRAIGHLCAVTLIALIAVSLFVSETIWLWWGAVVYASFNSLAIFYASDLKARGHFDHEAFWQIAWRSVTAIAVIAAVMFRATPTAAFWALACGLLIVLLSRANWLNLNRPRFRFSPSLYKPVLALIIVDAATTIYFRIDMILLERMGTSLGMVGLYAAAYKVIEGFSLLISPPAQIFFRKIRIKWSSGEEILAMTLKFSLLMMGLAAIIGGFLSLAGEPILVFILGERYAGVGAVLPWLMIALLFIFPNAILTHACLALDLEWWYAASAVITASVNIVLNLALIPHYNIIGAAWATIAAEAILSLSLLWSLFRNKKGIHAAQPGACS